MILRNIVSILAGLTAVECSYDFVVFTFDEKINHRLSNFDLQSEVNAAGTQNQLLLLFVDEFTIGEFSTFVNAYSQRANLLYDSANNITEAMRSAHCYDAGVMRTEHLNLPSNAVQYKIGESINKRAPVIYLVANSLHDADISFAKLRSSIISPYTVVIISSSVLDDDKYRSIQHTRTKRQSPIASKCHLQLNTTKVVMNNGKTTYMICYLETSVKNDCNEKVANFTIHSMQPQFCPTKKEWPKEGDRPNIIDIKLSFAKTSKNYWSLSSAELLSPKKYKKWNMNASTLVGIESLYWAGSTKDGFKCKLTPPLYKPQPHGDDITVTFAFGTLGMQPFGYNEKTFMDNLIDCKSPFSSGSLMGLMAGLIFIIGLLAAIGMLHQLKSMDRFDDPKGPQLQINTKGD